MRADRRFVRSLVLGPLVTFPVSVAVVLVWQLVGYHGEGTLAMVSETVSGATFISFFAVPVAYAAMLIVGIPTTLVLRRFGFFRLDVMTAVGALTGALPFLCKMNLFPLSVGMASGIVIACLVWQSGR